MCADNRSEGLNVNVEELEDLDYRPVKKCPECETVSGTHFPDCSKATVTITAQHAFSLAALVRHWRRMIDHLGQANCELTKEYCDEMLEDLGI